MFFKLFKNKNFLKLWISQTLSQLEATTVDFTVAVVIADAAINHRGFSESATSIVFALQFLPALPAALASGLIADTFNRRIQLIALNVFRSAFLLLFAFASSPGAHLFVFVFISAVCMHIYDVVEKSSLRMVVSQEEVGIANGLFLFTMNATTLIGVVAAGFLNQIIGLQGVMLSGSILYAFAAILVYKLPKNLQSNNHVNINYNKINIESSIAKLGLGIKDAAVYLKRFPPVLLCVLLATLVQTVTLMIASVSFKFGNDVLHISVSQVSLFLLIPVATGLALGGGISGIVTKTFSYRKVVFLSWFIVSFFVVVIGCIGYINTNLYPSITFSFILFEVILIITGIFTTLIQAPALEIIQKYADENIRGRVFGILVGGSNTFAGIIVAVSSIFIEFLHTKNFIIFVGIILLILLYFYRKIVDKYLHGQDFNTFRQE